MPLLPPAPGNTLVFTGTPTPPGAVTSIDQIGWAVESSDGNGNISMTSDPNDSTGMTAILAIPPEIALGAIITFWGVYRRTNASDLVIGPTSLTVTQ